MKKVERSIDAYTADDANLEDKDVYHSYINESRLLLIACEEKIDSLILNLDPEDPDDVKKIKQLEGVDKGIKAKFKKNSKEVKDRFAQLKAEFESSRPLSAAEKLTFDQEKKKVVEKKKKAELKMGSLLSKSQDLSRKMLELADVNTMTEKEIRENMLKTRDWEKEIDDLKTKKLELDMDLVGVEDVDQESVDLFKDEYKDALKSVEEAVKNLTLKDKELGLCSLIANKNKDSICYPSVFTGKIGENFISLLWNLKMLFKLTM